MLSLSTTSDVNVMTSWYNMSVQINCYFSISLFIFGTVGNILNILVLSQKSLRLNPCAWLFLISSFANLIVLLSGLTTRVLSYWTIDITDTIGWLCKLRVFTLYSSRTIASWLIVLASIDRWLLSCPKAHYRHMSTLKNVQIWTIIVILFSIVLYSQIFYCYDANLINTPLKCYNKTVKCRIFSDLIYACITVLFPLIMMFLFGILTLANVRKIKHRLQSPLLPRRRSNVINAYYHYQQQQHQHRLRLIDRHLFIMLLVQISFLALFTLPQAIEQIYLTITRDKHKTSERITVENSTYAFGILLTYFASGIPFYINTLSGGCVFREAFFTLIQRMKAKILCREK